MLGSLFLITSLLFKFNSAATSANPDSSEGTILYVTSPACGSFRCTVNWTQGSKVSVNWINPPSGDVSIALASNIGGAVYPIVSSTPATSTGNLCDAGGGYGNPVSGSSCGGVMFLVPGGWVAAANYTIVVTSLSNPTIVGYTDAITIISASGAPSGIVPTLLTISASSSTISSPASVAYTTPAATSDSGSGPSSGSATTTAVAAPVNSGSSMIISTKSISTSTSGNSTASTPTSLNVTAAMASSTTSKGTSTGCELKVGRGVLVGGILVGLVGMILVV